MTLLKDLLALREPASTPITEARGGKSMQKLLDKWQDQNNINSFEGPSGRRNLEKLFAVLGYDSAENFLDDNPGAITAIMEFIASANVSEWEENLQDEVGDDDQDDDE